MPAAVNSKDIDELINNLKSGITLWEDLIAKSSKFSNSIKGMTVACSDLLDSMHNICDMASKSSYGLRNTGICLTKLMLREKKMELKVCNVSNALSENLVGELDKYVTEWKRSSVAMKKEREHEWRRANVEYQKSMAEVERTEKKLRKKNVGKVGLSETANLQMDYANQDAQNKRRYVEELERCALRRAALEERQRFKNFLTLLKPVLDCQLSLREDLDNLEEVVKQLYGEKAENLDMLPEELEQTIQEHVIDSTSRSSIPRSYSTLSKQHNTASNGSRTSLNSNSMSTNSSEWNSNSILMSACMEVSSRLNENMSNISHDSGIKSDKSYQAPYEVSISQEFQWDNTLTQVKKAKDENSDIRPNESESEDSSTEDDNDVSTDHNSQDGIIDSNNDVFPLPKRQSNEEPHFELPPDFPDALPPPPAPPLPTSTRPSLASDTTSSQSNYYQRDNLYPNQSIPPPVYSNLQELQINAAKKFGANTLSRAPTKERGQLDQIFQETQKPQEESNSKCTTSSDKDKRTLSSHTWSSVDLKEREVTNISPPSFYYDNNQESASTFGNMVEQECKSTVQNMIPSKTDMPIKSSMIRRGSFATEMQVPQTPKTTNTIRRPSVQEKVPLNMYASKNRGRSMSMTRESNYESDENETTPEDFNSIRQRIVSRINNEMKPPTLPKPDVQKKQTPNTTYMPCDYSHNLSSPVAIRSNRFFGERNNKQTISSTVSSQNQALKFQLLRGSGSQHPDMDSSAGERSASNDFDVSNMDLQPMTVSRKEDRFKQQLMQVLNASKPQDGIRTSQTESIQQPPAMSSFYNSFSSTSTISRGNVSHTKSKGKSSLPNPPKYNY